MSRKTRTPSRLPRKQQNAMRRNARDKRAKGLDNEISILRGYLRKCMYGPKVENREARMSKTLDLIVCALTAKSRLEPASSAPAEEGIENMLKEASEKFGLEIIPWDTNS